MSNEHENQDQKENQNQNEMSHEMPYEIPFEDDTAEVDDKTRVRRPKPEESADDTRISPRRSSTVSSFTDDTSFIDDTDFTDDTVMRPGKIRRAAGASAPGGISRAALPADSDLVSSPAPPRVRTTPRSADTTEPARMAPPPIPEAPSFHDPAAPAPRRSHDSGALRRWQRRLRLQVLVMAAGCLAVMIAAGAGLALLIAR